MTNVMIKEGTYKIRGKETCMQGLVFPLVEEFKVGAGGGYVTVDGSAVNGFPARNIKIKVSGVRDYTVVGDDVAATIVEETDEETVDRIRERFDMLGDMTKAVKKGDDPTYPYIMIFVLLLHFSSHCFSRVKSQRLKGHLPVLTADTASAILVKKC